MMKSLVLTLDDGSSLIMVGLRIQPSSETSRLHPLEVGMFLSPSSIHLAISSGSASWWQWGLDWGDGVLL